LCPRSLRISAHSPATHRRRRRAWGHPVSLWTPECRRPTTHYRNKRSSTTPGRWRPASRFLYNPNLNKSLRYKGFGGYLVERDPLRQWGQAQFRMVLTNRWPRSASTWLPLSKLPQRPALPPFAHPAAATGSPSRRANGQHRGRSRAGPIAGQDKPAVTIKARSS
jgi:hypothetical protein